MYIERLIARGQLEVFETEKILTQVLRLKPVNTNPQ